LFTCKVHTESSHFGKFFTCEVHTERSAPIFTIYASKYEAVYCKVQTNFGIFLLTRFISTHFLDLCIQIQSCFLGSSNAVWKFVACKVYRKSYWDIFAICVSKNEVLLLSSSAAYWKFSACNICKKVLGVFILLQPLR